MKKQIKLAVAAVIMFGSLNAMADDQSFEEMMNTDSKIVAGELDQMAHGLIPEIKAISNKYGLHKDEKLAKLIAEASRLESAAKNAENGGFVDAAFSRVYDINQIIHLNADLMEIRQIVTEIGMNTTENSQVLTGVSQIEEEAIRIVEDATKATDSKVIENAGQAIFKAKEQLLKVRKQQ